MNVVWLVFSGNGTRADIQRVGSQFSLSNDVKAREEYIRMVESL